MSRNKKVGVGVVLMGLICLMMPSTMNADTVNFDAINTASTPYYVNINSTTYLSQYGITLTNVTAGTTVGALCGQCGGNTIQGSSGPNVLAQFGNNSGETYTLQFASALNTLSFDIAGNTKNGGSGTLMSSWSVTAFNASNVAIGSFGNPNLFSTFSAFAPQGFTFNLSGIDHITVFTNCFNVCGTMVSIDDLSSGDIHQASPTPEPASLALLGSGLVGLAGAMRRKLAA